MPAEATTDVTPRRSPSGPSRPTVTERLRQAILRGDFAPRQRLVEPDLCEQFSSSRAAVRAALQELSGDGLVDLQRNKGARVRAVSLAEAIEITEVRMVVEGLCAAKAAERVDEEQAEELLVVAAEMRTACTSGELLVYSELNARLHRRVREIADHSAAVQVIERLGAQVLRHQFHLALTPGRPAVSLPQHERIVAAVVARDPAGAEAAMREHLLSVRDALRASAGQEDPDHVRS